ncbi:MAG TPA: cupredoxin domain-containing protein [Actinomycetota bacterium]
MSKRLLLLACAGALLAASCSEPPTATVDFGSGQGFVPYVVDFLDDVGSGNGVAVDVDGVPFISYWGFPGTVEEGGLPAARAIGMPYLPSVNVASEQDGIFTRGAVAQVRDTPSGITIPYGPATVASLESASPQNANGTDIAVDDSGARHVTWAANTGIWYATGTASSQAEQVTKQTPQLNRAGPLGWPSIAVDGAGVPWIAFTVNTGAGLDVTLATPGDDGWTTEVVASTDPCSGCGPAPRTQVVVTDAGPEVIYVDGAAASVMAAINDGENGWVSFPVETGVSGAGLSAAPAGDGTVAAYYTGSGEVHVARSTDGTTWDAAAAGQVEGDADLVTRPEATTGIAAADDGTIYLAWFDPVLGVSLATSSDGTAFQPVDVGPSVEGGAYPSVAVAADGSRVFLTWYDTAGQDLMLGIWGDVEGLAVAAPSPTPEPGAAPPPSNCGEDGQIQLDIIALNIAFDPTCLVAPAGEPFTISFDNQDAVATTGPHNIVITAPDDSEVFAGDLIDGPAQVGYEVGALDEGSYPFHCAVHPTMTGVLAVVSGAAGGGGGGNGGGGGGAATGATGATGSSGATGATGA